MMGKPFYTTRELAEKAARRGRPVTQEYIRQQCADGRIHAIQPARDWLIPTANAEAWLQHWLAKAD
jgi:hypothetical protein